ncbi:MAG: NAD(P)-dependent oxidoreductase [Gammaproteobacteria bacterium]
MSADSEPVRRVGFIGLGRQGAPMARRILAAFPLTIWARRPATVESFGTDGVDIADSPAALGAACDFVGLCVTGDADFVETMCGRGLIDAMRPGAVAAIHGTISPDTCVAITRYAAARGVHVLDAPVSGGAPAAREGTLAVMVGGDSGAFVRARPVLETFGSTVRHVGPAGQGQICKLVNNVLLMANIRLAQAALALGAGFGMDRHGLYELLMASSGASAAMRAFQEQVTPEVAPHMAALGTKDLALLLAAAGNAGLDAAPLDAMARQALDMLRAGTGTER